MAQPALEIVYDPADAEVDVVAVHGLGANVDWTWIWKDPKIPSCQVSWLSDSNMLPAVVPKARVITYSYDSKWHSNAPRITLQICGDRFIQTLHDFRKDLPERPIVFLGHSLGSIVIQQGLLIADVKDDLRYLTVATSGLVTLGSPLRGIRKNVQPSFLIKLLRFRGSWGGVLDELRYENDTLLERLERFIRLSKARNFDVFCFFELYETKFGKKFSLGGKFGVPLKAMIVPETSACMSGFERCGLQADHFRINKFSGPNDASFMRVSAQLLQLCNKATSSKRKMLSEGSLQQARSISPPLVNTQNPVEIEQCLKQLFLTNPMNDLSFMRRLKGERAEGTCEWILETSEMREWLSEDQSELGTAASNFLWLQGDPGVGKSTMAMFLAEHFTHQNVSREDHATAFFLCSSSFNTRNNATAILRGLLWQLLSTHHHLVARHILPVYKNQGSSIYTSFDSLWSIFLSVMGDKHPQKIKYLIVDGLDECKTDRISGLLKMVKGAFGPRGSLHGSFFCRLLILSRPAANIQRAFRGLRAINLSASLETRNDIAAFIREKVSDLEISIPYPPAIARDVAQILERKAGGTFLWAGLACAELENCDAKDAVRCLDTLPAGLNDLYGDILASACGNGLEDKAKIRQLLGFSIAAMYPLSLLELSAACKLHTQHSAQTRRAFMLEEIESCRRLLVVIDGRVHALHESVKDFLESEASGSFLNDEEINAQLARRCIEVIYWSGVDVEQSMARGLVRSDVIEWSRFARGFGQIREKFENLVPGSLTFLGYAMLRWPAHVRSARDKFTVSGLALLFFDSRSVLWKAWSAVFLAHLMQPSDVVGHLVKYAGQMWQIWTPLDVAALTDTPVLAEFALQQQGHFVEGRHVMYAAVENHWDMFNLMMNSITKHVHLAEMSVEKFVLFQRGWSRASEVLQDLFAHPKVHSPFEPSLLILAARNDLKTFYLLLELRPKDLTLAASCIGDWTDGGWNMDNHIEASKALAENQIPGFIDSDLVMEYLVSEKDCKWPVKAILEVLQVICCFRSKTTSIPQTVWLKAAGNPLFGLDVVRLLLTRGAPAHMVDQEDLLQAAARNGKLGPQILNALFDATPTRLPLGQAVTDKVLSVALQQGAEEQVQVLLEHSPFDASKLQEEKMLIAACCNVDRFMGFVFMDNHLSASKITEPVLSAAARNQAYGREYFELLLARCESLPLLSKEVVWEAAQNGGGLLDLLLDRNAFDESTITRTFYNSVEMTKTHNRSGNLSKCLLQRRDPALPVPDITAVTRHLTKLDVEDLLDWQGDHIISKEVVVVAIESYGALLREEDILPLVHKANPNMVMIDTEVLECARLQLPEMGFDVPGRLIERVREIRGGHLLSEEEEAVRVWWPRHAQLDLERIRLEILESKRKYQNIEAAEAKASFWGNYTGSTGNIMPSRQRRASCCFPLDRQPDHVKAHEKRRNSVNE